MKAGPGEGWSARTTPSCTTIRRSRSRRLSLLTAGDRSHDISDESAQVPLRVRSWGAHDAARRRGAASGEGLPNRRAFAWHCPELIKEIVPMVSRLAVLWNTGNLGIEVSVREMEQASPQFGVQLHTHGVSTVDDFPVAFARVTRERASALFVFDDVLITTHKRQILDWAAKVRLPVMSQYAELAEAGGLMAYGPNIPDIYRRAAYFVDKILKGARPADLPVEQPTQFELLINLKTAKALSLTIP